MDLCKIPKRIDRSLLFSPKGLPLWGALAFTLIQIVGIFWRNWSIGMIMIVFFLELLVQVLVWIVRFAFWNAKEGRGYMMWIVLLIWAGGFSLIAEFYQLNRGDELLFSPEVGMIFSFLLLKDILKFLFPQEQVQSPVWTLRTLFPGCKKFVNAWLFIMLMLGVGRVGAYLCEMRWGWDTETALVTMVKVCYILMITMRYICDTLEYLRIEEELEKIRLYKARQTPVSKPTQALWRAEENAPADPNAVQIIDADDPFPFDRS